MLDIKAVFRMFAKGKDHLTVQETIRILESNGFLSDDPRWAQYYQMFLTVE